MKNVLRLFGVAIIMATVYIATAQVEDDNYSFECEDPTSSNICYEVYSGGELVEKVCGIMKVKSE